MSVIVTLQLEGDPAKLEEYAAANAGEMAAIVATATKHGLLAHRFLGADGGKIMVTDEWPDAESFQAFFDEAGGAIQKMSDGAGVSVAGQPEFWRVLESHDKYGWES